MSDSHFVNVVFKDVDFEDCNLLGSKFSGCTFPQCRFRGCYLPAIEMFSDCRAESIGVFESSFVFTEDWISNNTDRRIQLGSSDSYEFENWEYRVEPLNIRMSGMSIERSAGGRRAVFSGPAYYGTHFKIGARDKRVSMDVSSVFASATAEARYEEDSDDSQNWNVILASWEEVAAVAGLNHPVDFSIPTEVRIDCFGKIHSAQQSAELERFIENLGENVRSVQLRSISPSESFSLNHFTKISNSLRAKGCKIICILPNYVVVPRE